MITEEFTFPNSRGDKLAATNELNIDGDPPVALLLHGMHESGRQVFAGLAPQLAARGIGSLRFDQQGWGDSGGRIGMQTLNGCLKNAQAALRQFKAGRARLIIGHSMGSHLTACLLENTTPDAIVLFAPATYATAVGDLPFSTLAHQPDDWRRSAAFEALRSFKGRVLIISGSEDELLPPEMLDAYEENCTSAARLEVLVLEGGPHGLQGWLQQPENNSVRQQVLDAIVDFAG